MPSLKQYLKKTGPLLFIAFAVSAVMTAVMIALTIYRSVNHVPGENLAVLIGNILLWLVPFAAKWLFKEKISDGIYFFFVIYAFFASFLGSIMSFYGKYWWYDIVIHTIFGYVACMIGLFFVCKLCEIYKTSPLFVVLVCVSVSLAFAVLWKIFEFTTDEILNRAASGTHAAQGMPFVDENGDYFIPVTDTMIDMICHTCGSVVFIVHYTVHTLTKKSLFLDALKKDFSSGKKESPVQAELSPDAHTEE